MTPAERFQYIKALGRALKVMHHDKAIYDLVGQRGYNHRFSMTSAIHDHRNTQRRLLTSNWKDDEELKIRSDFNAAFGTKRNVSVKVGKHPEVIRSVAYTDTGSTYSYRVTLGWMWRHKVYIPFYKDNRLDRRYIVLTAEELSVNHRAIRLYEATAFSFKEGKTEQVYIGQASIGGQNADVRPTAKEAIERALKLADRTVTKRLLGDDHAE